MVARGRQRRVKVKLGLHRRAHRDDQMPTRVARVVERLDLDVLVVLLD